MGVGEGWETDTAPAVHVSQAPGVPFHLDRLEMFVPEEIMTDVSCGALRCLTTGLWGWKDALSSLPISIE